MMFIACACTQSGAKPSGSPAGAGVIPAPPPAQPQATVPVASQAGSAGMIADSTPPVSQSESVSTPAMPPLASAGTGSSNAPVSPQPNAGGAGVGVGGAEPPQAGAGSPPSAAGGSAPQRVDPVEWQELIATDWELAGGTEQTFCVRRTLEREVALSGFKPILPKGTHHTVVSIGPAQEPDGVVQGCSSLVTAATGVWGSGVQTPPFEFPDGVGMVLPAGQQLLLTLHVYNTDTQPLRGHSGTAVRPAARTAISQLAEVTLAGPVLFAIPPGKAQVSGSCTFADPSTVIAIGPHMHRMGRHARFVAIRAGQADRVLHDAEFDFGEQRHYPVDNMRFEAGDRLDVTCTYENDSKRIVGFGESASDEMCFAVLVRYPVTHQPGCIL